MEATNKRTSDMIDFTAPSKRIKLNPQYPPWHQLLPELLVHIGSFLEPIDLLHARASCSSWSHTFTLSECFYNATILERSQHLLSVSDPVTAKRVSRLLNITHLNVAECTMEWSRHLSGLDNKVPLAALQTIPVWRMRMRHKMELLLQMMRDGCTVDTLRSVMEFLRVTPSYLTFEPEWVQTSVALLVDKYCGVLDEDEDVRRLELLSVLGVDRQFVRTYNSSILGYACDTNNKAVVYYLHKFFGLNADDARGRPIVLAVTRCGKGIAECLVNEYGINGSDIYEAISNSDFSDTFWEHCKLRTHFKTTAQYLSSVFPKELKPLKLLIQ